MTEAVMDADTFLDHLTDLFAAHGATLDIGHRLSNAAHMLQAAAAAEEAGADDSLIAACLLHDIGHWLHAGPANVSAQDHDDRHEEVAAHYLAPYFDESVTRPIALHVAAKRYLCAVEPSYFDALSPGSTRTLELQGGPMSADEVTAFAAIPQHQDALAMRRWDEYGKVPGLDVPGFDAYRPMLRKLMRT